MTVTTETAPVLTASSTARRSASWVDALRQPANALRQHRFELLVALCTAVFAVAAAGFGALAIWG